MVSAVVFWDQLTWLLGIIVLVIGGLFWYQYQMGLNLHKRISDYGDRFSNYQLAAMDKFVSLTHLREVEDRLVRAVDGLRSDIRDLTKAMTKHLVDDSTRNGNNRRHDDTEED
jgi:hypothetical protein